MTGGGAPAGGAPRRAGGHGDAYMGARRAGAVLGQDRGGVSKVYCERCDAVFSSRAEYERHLDRHAAGGAGAGGGCEECPLDTAVSKFLGLFRKRGGGP